MIFIRNVKELQNDDDTADDVRDLIRYRSLEGMSSHAETSYAK